MKKRSLNLTDELYQYMLDISLKESEIAERLRDETKKMLVSALQSPPEESQFIALLLRLFNAKRIIEVGTFTGYTTLIMAQTIPSDGKIYACDISEKWTSIGRKYWEEAGVEEKIELNISPAIETLERLLSEGLANTFDFIFIDADKDHYVEYYEKARKLIRIGGLIAIDNVFWNGAVINDLNNGSDVLAIRKLNKIVLEEKDFDISTVPIGDGLTLALRKR